MQGQHSKKFISQNLTKKGAIKRLMGTSAKD